MGSDGAPHRRATSSATEDDYLYHESLHTDSAPAAPPRDDLPDGPEVAPQDDRQFPRRTTLDMVASNSVADHKAALNATVGLHSTPSRSATHLPSMHTGPAVAISQPPRPALPPAGPLPLHRVVAPLWQKKRTLIGPDPLRHGQAYSTLGARAVT